MSAKQSFTKTDSLVMTNQAVEQVAKNVLRVLTLCSRYTCHTDHRSTKLLQKHCKIALHVRLSRRSAVMQARSSCVHRRKQVYEWPATTYTEGNLPRSRSFPCWQSIPCCVMFIVSSCDSCTFVTCIPWQQILTLRHCNVVGWEGWTE